MALMGDTKAKFYCTDSRMRKFDKSDYEAACGRWLAQRELYGLSKYAKDIEVLNAFFGFLNKGLKESDFPNYFKQYVAQNAKVTGFGSGSNYTLCQSAPSGGSRCSGCGALNEFAGPNMGDKYVCYECR